VKLKPILFRLRRFSTILGDSHHAKEFPWTIPSHMTIQIIIRKRNGLMLFALYVALYAGFMFLNAFAPERMKQPVLAGVNLAIIYGMGLIVAALVLALVYMQLCKPTRA
jgi:uncharacterized membrane protein (DUF485 family)